jgi:diphosphomevalonate decarboxylase
MKKVRAKACSNIAIIKYWGKRDSILNLPAVGSISLTLKELYTTTLVIPDPSLSHDMIKMNGITEGEAIDRISGFLNLIRELKDSKIYFHIQTENNFPTGAGLASSASGFAALAAAASRAVELPLSGRELSILARRGSGSAARSIFGGIVEMKKGENPDGTDSYAYQLYDPSYWDLRVLVMITSEDEKRTKSTRGMELTRQTSPYYKAWLDTHSKDLEEARMALKQKDLEKLGELIEHNSFKMHATMMTARPAILYWNSLTVEIIHRIRYLRQQNILGYVTIDAGPQVKVITLPRFLNRLKEEMGTIPGIKRIIETSLGPGVEVYEENM